MWLSSFPEVELCSPGSQLLAHEHPATTTLFSPPLNSNHSETGFFLTKAKLSHKSDLCYALGLGPQGC